jgi:Fe-S protein assembly co-chaperone HscB
MPGRVAESAAPAASACPACGQALRSTLACLACGRLLEEGADADHFARLGAPRSPVIDRAALEQAYIRLSRLLHPDFHGGSSELLRERANRSSALLNEAWSVLTDDQERAEYLLERLDPGVLERNKTLPPALLMQAMELSEEVEAALAARDAAGRQALAARVRDEMATRAATLGDPARWQQPDTATLARLLHEQRVFRRILRDAGEAP